MEAENDVVVSDSLPEPDAAPVEVPADAPAEVPADTSADTPAEVPADTSADTPADAPAEPPAESTEESVESPSEVPAESVEGSVEVPAEDFPSVLSEGVPTTTETVQVLVLEERPFMTTSFADYTVTEGLLLLILVLLFVQSFLGLIRRWF